MINGKFQANVLIVDDNIENLYLLKAILENNGHLVRPALTGKIALEAAQASPPDLIVLDIMMPDLNGYQGYAQLKAIPHLAEIPIIFIGAPDNVQDKVKAFEAGCDDFILKPFQENQIFDILARYLNVQYTYGKPDGHTSVQEEHRLQQAMSMLPASLLRQLHRAAIEADIEKVRTAIEKIRQHDTQIANALYQLLADFQFDVLINLIRRKDETK